MASAYYFQAKSYSRSFNAYEAEREGRLPATRAAKKYGYKSAKALRSVLSTSEWHHVGKYATEVDYYDVPQCEADFLCGDDLAAFAERLNHLREAMTKGGREKLHQRLPSHVKAFFERRAEHTKIRECAVRQQRHRRRRSLHELRGAKIEEFLSDRHPRRLRKTIRTCGFSSMVFADEMLRSMAGSSPTLENLVHHYDQTLTEFVKTASRNRLAAAEHRKRAEAARSAEKERERAKDSALQLIAADPPRWRVLAEQLLATRAQSPARKALRAGLSETENLALTIAASDYAQGKLQAAS